MKILCAGCERVIDTEINRYATIIDAVTGKAEIICQKCKESITGTVKINALLREVSEKPTSKTIRKVKG